LNIQRIAAWVLLLSLCAVSSCSQFEPRDKRFYYRLAFIATKPRLNPNEEAIAPSWPGVHKTRIGPRTTWRRMKRTRKVKFSAYAITTQRLDHQGLDQSFCPD
jgi:hypothetical protein